VSCLQAQAIAAYDPKGRLMVREMQTNQLDKDDMMAHIAAGMDM
jgi:hypothetical protein